MNERALALEPRLRADQAIEEASRCLQCFDPPCAGACPAGIVVPRFIRMIKSGNLSGAAEVVRSANPMVMSCGVACPDEQLCGAACIRGQIDRPIEIRRLHRYATEIGEAEWRRAAMRPTHAAGPRVAIVGAGPAGLSCASVLRRGGARVTLYEAADRPGGVLARTIPLYRFPDRVVKQDIRWISGASFGARLDLKLGAEVRDLKRLAARFDAVLVATGLCDVPAAWEGAALPQVVSAEAFLARCRKSAYRNPVGEEIAVIGGGNVAIDAAMAAVSCGGPRRRQVHLVYRRSRSEMPAWEREIALAERAGVRFHFLVAPRRFVAASGKGKPRLGGIEMDRVRLVGGRARPRPVTIPGSAFFFPCDMVILATGQRVEPAILAQLASLRRNEKIFVAGDVAGSEQAIVSAVRDGKGAAHEILAWCAARRAKGGRS
jgi:dihydropyrimidine dehydrogenase (NAD+) subunit PreT